MSSSNGNTNQAALMSVNLGLTKIDQKIDTLTQEIKNENDDTRTPELEQELQQAQEKKEQLLQRKADIEMEGSATVREETGAGTEETKETAAAETAEATASPTETAAISSVRQRKREIEAQQDQAKQQQQQQKNGIIPANDEPADPPQETTDTDNNNDNTTTITPAAPVTDDPTPGDENDQDRIEFGTLAEQKDEAYYDDRSDADDDLHKGRIKFPKRLYGRDKELAQLTLIYQDMMASSLGSSMATSAAGLGGSMRNLRASQLSQQQNQGGIQEEEDNEQDDKTERVDDDDDGNGDNDNKTTPSKNTNNNSTEQEVNRRVVFLGGLSGTGKTALVQEFVKQLASNQQQQQRQQQQQQQRHHSIRRYPVPTFVQGKFSQLQSGDPFSAMAQGWNAHLLHMINSTDQQYAPDQLVALKRRLRQADIEPSSEWTAVLQQTMLPNLPDFLAYLNQAKPATTVTVTGSTDEGDNDDKTNQHQDTTNGVNKNTITSNDSTHDPDDDFDEDDPAATTGASTLEMSTITYAFGQFLQAFVQPQQPLVWMVDDLQWADAASFQLLQSLLVANGAMAQCHVLFVGAYRSNEVTELTPFSELKIKTIEANKDEHAVTLMEIDSLTPDDVGQFIADCIHRDTQEIESITEAVYSKTLGNIFFVQQALEELVRQNAIYYDVMMFEWKFGDVTRVELEDCLSDDVVQLVQNKLRTLPHSLTRALAVAALTKQSFDVTWLSPLVEAVNWNEQGVGEEKEGDDNTSIPALQQLMKLAFEEGLVLHDATATSQNDTHGEQWLGFKFSHDRIREAACNTVPEGTELYDVVLKSIATVLLDQYDRMGMNRSAHSRNSNNVAINDDIDWMLFTAASHLNAVSAEHTQAIPVAELNLKVGRIAIAKGAFGDSITFFRAGVERLEKTYASSCWKNHYNLILQLYNFLLESHHTMNEYQQAQLCVEKVFENATSLEDKLRAQRVFLHLQVGSENRNYKAAVDPGLELLRLYNIDIPAQPTERQIRREKFRLQVALRGRNLMCLATFPIASEEVYRTRPEKLKASDSAEGEDLSDFESHSSRSIKERRKKAQHHISTIAGPMRIAHITLRNAWLGGRPDVVQLLGHRMLRLALTNKVITKNLAFVLMALGSPSVREEKYERAFLYANSSQAVLDRFPREKSQDFLMSKVILYSALIVLRVPFREAIEPFMDMYKGLLAAGDTDTSFGSAMNGMMLYFIAALPLGSFMEPRLLLFQESATSYGKKSFITVFGLYKQMLYNLQGGLKSSANPTEIDGPAASELEIMAFSEGPAEKMNNRDIGIIRLQLAVIFNDRSAMEEQMKRLDPYPIFDPPFPRQYWRMCYMGFAALILAGDFNYTGCKRKESCTGFPFKKKQETELIPKWADACIQFFEKLSGFGSPNAHPVNECYKALCKPSIAAFDNSIEVSGNYGLLNLVALMSERCALWLLGQRPVEVEDCETVATEYLKMSMWCYHDWGASNKVAALQRQYPELVGAMREKPPSALSSTRRQAHTLGVPRRTSYSVAST